MSTHVSGCWKGKKLKHMYFVWYPEDANQIVISTNHVTISIYNIMFFSFAYLNIVLFFFFQSNSWIANGWIFCQDINR